MTKVANAELVAAIVEAGIADVDHPEYGTTALTIMADVVLRTNAKGSLPSVSDVNRAAPGFLDAWRRMRNGGGSYKSKAALPGDVSVNLRKYNDISITRQGSSETSYSVDSMSGRLVKATRKRPEPDARTERRIRMITDYVRGRVEASLAHLVAEDPVRDRSSHLPYSPYRIEVLMKTGFRSTVNIAANVMKNDSDADLLRPIEHEMDDLIAQQLNFRYDAPNIERLQRTIDREVEKSGLPVSIRIVPGSGTNSPVPLMLTGYGDNGVATTRKIGDTTHNTKNTAKVMGEVAMALCRQTEIHALHGPTPRDHLSEAWTVDAILDRHVRRITGSQHILREMLEDERLWDARIPEVTLRLSGTRVYGTIQLAPRVISHGDRVRINDAALSMTVVNTLRDQPLRHLAEHPDFPEDMLISRCQTFYSKHCTYTVAHTRKYQVPLAA